MVLAAIASMAVSCSDNKVGPDTIVDGVVHLRDGPPLPGVVVSFFKPAPPAPGNAVATGAPRRASILPYPMYATTDANGRFAVRLPRGAYEVWIGAAPDSGVMSQQVGSVTVGESHVSLDLHYQGYRVTGAMQFLNLMLSVGSVFVLGTTNTARAELHDEAYSLLLPGGTYDFWANPSEGYAQVPRVKYEGITVSSDTTIVLSVDGHFVGGTVTGPGGVILYGATVGATAPNASAFDHTSSIGRYGVHLPSGTYTFIVTPPAGADTLQPLTVTGVAISAPQTLDFQLLHTP